METCISPFSLRGFFKTCFDLFAVSRLTQQHGRKFKTLKAFYLWCQLCWLDHLCPHVQDFQALILFRDLPGLVFIKLGIAANQLSGTPTFVPRRGHQRSTEFNIPQPWGEQSVTLNSKELWGSVSTRIAHSCLDSSQWNIMNNYPLFLYCWQLYVKKNVSQNLYDIYLTFSLELSPSHDFNSDKCKIYIGGVHFKVPQK